MVVSTYSSAVLVTLQSKSHQGWKGLMHLIVKLSIYSQLFLLLFADTNAI